MYQNIIQSTNSTYNSQEMSKRRLCSAMVTYIFHSLSIVGCLTNKSEVAYPLTSGRFSTDTRCVGHVYIVQQNQHASTRKTSAPDFVFLPKQTRVPVLDIRTFRLPAVPIECVDSARIEPSPKALVQRDSRTNTSTHSSRSRHTPLEA